MQKLIPFYLIALIAPSFPSWVQRCSILNGCHASVAAFQCLCAIPLRRHLSDPDIFCWYIQTLVLHVPFPSLYIGAPCSEYGQVYLQGVYYQYGSDLA